MRGSDACVKHHIITYKEDVASEAARVQRLSDLLGRLEK